MIFMLVFTIVWVSVFTMMLPIGVKMSATVEKGHASSAPIVHYMGRKIILSVALSVLITYLIYDYLPM